MEAPGNGNDVNVQERETQRHDSKDNPQNVQRKEHVE
jgi:hypothetical protein